ncbi:hypothetical protein KGM_216129 [Danaus plexippus plexippus]|uniref:Uncharacterized protein n=1 Tax=Danaus plexippus plexippus TaxID=278856 RepID=A0A212F023_DANPL|nr:hypothetical protein KGM_216129 [Danaus plexippus plexippus]
MFLCYFLFLTAVHQISGGRIPEYVIKELYSKYEEAMANEHFKIFTRRIFRGNKKFEIHVEKLREVNGYKKHNLMVKESLKSGAGSYIYINNPVESKIPKAFLTLDEFKDALTNRILVQREELIKKQSTTNKNLNTMKYFTQTSILNESRLHGYNTSDKYVHRKATTKSKANDYVRVITYKTYKSNEILDAAVSAFNEKNTLDTDNTNSTTNEGSIPPETESVKLVPINNTSTNTDMPLMRNDSVTDMNTTLSVRINKTNEHSGVLNATDSEKHSMRNESDVKIIETLSRDNASVLKTDTSEILPKATPRRKVTVKLQSATTATTNRITLGRPLVFLAN